MLIIVNIVLVSKKTICVKIFITILDVIITFDIDILKFYLILFMY